MTMLKQIQEIKEDSRQAWLSSKTKKERYKEILKALEGLIEGRAYLSEYCIDDIVGFQRVYVTEKIKYGLSYRQIRNNVIRYIKTGKLLKKPYKISNTEDFTL